MERVIRFSDATRRIVFYPQYFVMLNGVVEDWLNKGLGVGYRELVLERRIGLPTVRLEADFSAVSRMGDHVVLSVAVERLGKRSLTLAFAAKEPDGDPRMAVRQVLVTTSLDTHRAVDLPADFRAAIARATASSQSMKNPRCKCSSHRPAASQGLRQRRRHQRKTGFRRRHDRMGCARPFPSDDFAAQARRALEIVEVLREADGKPEHIVRMTWYVTDKREYLAAAKEVGSASGVIGSYNAAMTAVEVKALIEDRAKVEIEATAVIPD